ncbi:MAG: transcription elongation factor subunit Spt4 [Nitrososphaerota archaeon]|nr:DNA-directed RNA polymerase, subunit E'' [Candidatus Bathyarchaeota archaeon]MDW8048234.1 transcription elongation factor subunit Spt4 [Nitrososphaerota archaeon]
MVEKACRNCHLISDQNTCPNCKSSDLSEDFTGLAIILDPERSAIANIMKIDRKGRYAIKIR